MKISFSKYHGTGNDFVLVDDWDRKIERKLNRSTIKNICQRRFGVGADGMILLQRHSDFDFEMKYYNSDGRESSMCGNGGRCIVQFAYDLKRIKRNTRFLAIDGPHEGRIDKEGVHIKMKDVSSIKHHRKDLVLDTGSPHYVRFVSDVSSIDTPKVGSRIRNSVTFKKKGINVNFVEEVNGKRLKMTTFERGVEDETFSCGTGVVAASIAHHYHNKSKYNSITVLTKGGKLEVSFEESNELYSMIWLTGPVKRVAQGIIDTTLF